MYCATPPNQWLLLSIFQKLYTITLLVKELKIIILWIHVQRWNYFRMQFATLIPMIIKESTEFVSCVLQQRSISYVILQKCHELYNLQPIIFFRPILMCNILFVKLVRDCSLFPVGENCLFRLLMQICISAKYIGIAQWMIVLW